MAPFVFSDSALECAPLSMFSGCGNIRSSQYRDALVVWPGKVI